MTGKDERSVQDNRIRPTPEIGCRGTYPCAACLHAGQTHAVVPMQPARSGNGGITVTAATRVERGGRAYPLAHHSRLRRGAGWVGIDLRHSSDSFGRSWHHGRGVVQAQPVQEAVSTRYGWPTLPRSACTPSTRKACRRGLGPCVATGQEARRLQSVLWMERFSASSSRLERHPDHDPDKGRVRYVIVDLHSASGSRRHSAGRPDTRTANGDHRGGAAAISYITAGSVCP